MWTDLAAERKAGCAETLLHARTNNLPADVQPFTSVSPHRFSTLKQDLHDLLACVSTPTSVLTHVVYACGAADQQRPGCHLPWPAAALALHYSPPWTSKAAEAGIECEDHMYRK
jgi:hypothetical protein